MDLRKGIVEKWGWFTPGSFCNLIQNSLFVATKSVLNKKDLGLELFRLISEGRLGLQNKKKIGIFRLVYKYLIILIL